MSDETTEDIIDMTLVRVLNQYDHDENSQRSEKLGPLLLLKNDAKVLNFLVFVYLYQV